MTIADRASVVLSWKPREKPMKVQEAGAAKIGILWRF